MPISNTRSYVLKAEYTHHDVVALTQAAANAATGDYTVADLIDLVNAAIETKYDNVSNTTVGGKTTGTIGLATSTQN
jgi:uncharacterized radical SAM superfamily Fe-S cluster-containing enzyme